MKLAHSPITQHTFNDIAFYLKRDDQLHPTFSGNKARKFTSELYDNDTTVKTLISYGSIQSNSMYSLAALAALKGWAFEFYVTAIPKWLRKNPIGNYRAALELGTQFTEVGKDTSSFEYYLKTVRQPDNSCKIIPEGGHYPKSELGIQQLAEEIIDWFNVQEFTKLTVALPSGTGTTSLYLHKHLKGHSIDVLTCPTVGDKHYLIEQFQELGEESYPNIITPSKKFYFGHLYPEFLDIWHQLKQSTQVEFELLYDPMMWLCLQEYQKTFNDEHALLYIHQGGLLGNESMLPRYRRGGFTPNE
ncbi:1-aminocyclopropane-1-carboxylate deaminase/D-cysteine desulfhydrase [Vibrio sp.]|nr:1-aminocyclopropane-1-carboxylate deaminase/D-cysteine desulfhydrase [Vibrio sp.]